MKKVLLGLLFSAVGTFAFGQSPRIEGHDGYIVDPTMKPTPFKQKSQAKKEEVSGWYNWMDNANTVIGTEFQFFNNSTIFPDSTVKQIYGNAAGGTELSYVGTHGAGQVFDPKSSYFDNPDAGLQPLSRYNPYRWDSVAMFISNYKHLVPGSVDTLIFYFFTSRNNGIRTQNLSAPGGSSEQSANVNYNMSQNGGSGHIHTFKYLLDGDDTTSEFKAIIVPTNGSEGINVSANQLAAFTISYRPGFAYTLGDTIDEAWTSDAITKKLNHLEIALARETSKADHESYNHSLRLFKDIRYNKSTNGWNGQYYPGDGVISEGNGHLYSSFFITSMNVGMEEGAFKGYGVSNIYPNPATNLANLTFELPKTENVTVSVYNAVGQKINTIAEGNYAAGKHNVQFSVENLNAGAYFYTINAGGYARTMKFTVVK